MVMCGACDGFVDVLVTSGGRMTTLTTLTSGFDFQHSFFLPGSVYNSKTVTL